MAPFFGASTIVWANTIGVVLVALSVGYWLGGRIADRHPHLRGLCLLVLAAAVLIAIVPFVARPFLDVSVDALDEISAGALRRLAASAVLVLVAVPVILLGACSPWAVRLAVPDVEHSGAVAGRLYAISTAGSLLGTMARGAAADPARRDPAHLPRLRARARAGRGGRARLALRRRPGRAGGGRRAARRDVKAADDGRVLYEGETEHQYVRVVEEPDGDRLLELNEGQAMHSLYRPGTYLTGDYWDAMLDLPVRGPRRGRRERIAILGNAAGTTARAYGHYFPDDARRRGRDRRRADRARAPLLRPRQPAA